MYKLVPLGVPHRCRVILWVAWVRVAFVHQSTPLRFTFVLGTFYGFPLSHPAPCIKVTLRRKTNKLMNKNNQISFSYTFQDKNKQWWWWWWWWSFSKEGSLTDKRIFGEFPKEMNKLLQLMARCHQNAIFQDFSLNFTNTGGKERKDGKL